MGATSKIEIEAAIVERPCEKLDLMSAALFALGDNGAYYLAAQRNRPLTALQVILPDDGFVARLTLAAQGKLTLDVAHDRKDFPTGTAQPNVALTSGTSMYVEAFVFFSGHIDGSALSPDEAALVTHFVRECGAIRAHVAAIAMSREILRLREALLQSESRRSGLRKPSEA